MNKIKVLILVMLALAGCNRSQKDVPQVSEDFAQYISAFTSGVISSQSNIQIRFASTIKSEVREKAAEEKLFEFKPALKGSASWADPRVVAFIPADGLEQGTVYTGKFHLYKLMDVPDHLKTIEFQFQAIQQSIFVEVKGLSSYDDEHLEWQQIEGVLRTADYAEPEQLEHVLGANQNSKKLKISWSHNPAGTEHNFKVDSVSRKKEKEQVLLKWNGKRINSEDKGEQQVDIPPLGDFKLTNTYVTQQPDQTLSLYFSDPIHGGQDLTGLIYFQSGEALKLYRMGNEVRIYPANRLTGNKTIIISDALKNSLGYSLVESYKQEVVFTSIKPSVKLIGDGVILPSTDGLVFPFKAVNLRAVNVRVIKIFEDNLAQFFQLNQYDGNDGIRRVGRMVLKKEVELRSDKPVDRSNWNTYYLDLSNLIETEPGAIYNVSITFDRSQSLLPCTKDDKDKPTAFDEDNELREFNEPPASRWDNGFTYLSYNWREKDDPCTDSYYAYRINRREANRNVLASNLGIIAKGGDDTDLFVAVTDLVSANPLSGVEVEIYNYQKQLMGVQKTDGKGMLNISLNQKPFLLVAKQGTQRGYLRLDDGSALSTSMFDVGGNRSVKGIKGFIYGERGVWRPGDSIYTTFVLEDKAKALPANHPVRFELYTPENQLYLNQTRTSSLNGVYDFRTATEADAPTGNWLAKVSVGGASFTKTIKIETVKPNRLKIEIDFGEDIIKDASTVGELSSKWLHGATARYLKADIEMTLKSGHTSFKGFEGYIFDDPAKEFESEEEKVFEGKLDSLGTTTFVPGIRLGKEAPGMLTAFFKTRVFENSGDFSVDRYAVPYSPYNSYVGVKIPDGPGWNGALYSDEKSLIPIVTVDEEGEPVDIKNLKIEIYDVRWRWWWDRDDYDNLASYVRNRSRNLIKSDKISTVDGRAVYELDFGEKIWGRKLIRITNPKSGHSTGTTIYLDYRGYWDNNSVEGPGGAEMLTFTTDKKDYAIGEKIQLKLPEIKEGRALVSLESGSKIIKTFWAEAPIDGNIEIKATAEMAPNVFIHISLIQPHKNTVNDLPIRLYGVQPVNVTDKNTILNPVLKMADVLEPEQEVTIEVSEKDGRDMTYTVAVVDEGLLDLTRFGTPNLWNYFYAREALGIRTWDMYKYVLGALKGEMAGLLSIGGDDALMKQDGKKNANRFKPVVKFLGPFELKKGKSNKHSFTMPNYVGSVKCMVVASNNGSYGKTEKVTPVKKPLMVLTTLPRVLSPNEKVTLPVTVFCMDPKLKDVTIELKTNDMFTVIGEKSKKIRFSREGDQLVYFELKTVKKIGAGKVEIFAKGGKHKASDAIDMQVRLPNPRITRTIHKMAEPGSKLALDYQAVGMAGTNNASLEVSSIPPLNLEQRLKYLTEYPHGCVEQTTSAAFPQLFLSRFIELDAEKKSEIQENVTEAVNKLKSYQLSSGGLSYWPGWNSYVSQWGTSYAGHFMLEAKAEGYKLPLGFIDNWVKYQTRMANSWDREKDYYGNYRGSELDQAYRLYTLALAKKPALGAMNRLRESNSLSTTAKWRLAGAYLLTGKKEVADELVAGLTSTVENYRELSYTYGSSLRDQAMILEIINSLGDKEKAMQLVQEISAEMSSGSWQSTQTTAYVLLAVAKFLGDSDATGSLKFDYSINGTKAVKVSTSAAVKQADLAYKSDNTGRLEINNKSDKKLFVNVQMDGVPLEGDGVKEDKNLGMTVRYLDMQGKLIDPAVLEQGTDFLAELSLKHPGIRVNYKELALTQMFPSGWEIRNLRMDNLDATFLKDKPDYQDIRDDRVYSYFNLNKRKSVTFVVMLNAAYLGEFWLPAVYCEAMYDKSIHATEPGKWVKVIKQK